MEKNTRDEATEVLEAFKEEVQEQLARGRASKRARLVAMTILERGSMTTSDLEDEGYKHAPRAVADLRDAGIEVEMEMEPYIDQKGFPKRRARYKIVAIDPLKKARRAVPKRLADQIKAPNHCEVCGATPPLQVDHRVPFAIGGETHPHIIEEFMPLCPSCNRSKSWTCENCPNWEIKDLDTCRSCMWASPSKYDHIAMKQVRQARVTIDTPTEVKLWDELQPNVKSIVTEWLHDPNDKRRGDDKNPGD
ncbi:hypothetical protein CGLAR1_01900 [Corynebacterium glutamicum]|uniref:HNH endonuclease signature motif containing protein n=1 Tax=Corynebacterium glutamicum TaxID=1718 RepID=UPI0004F64BA6|nr:HNH endonuclease signature motif containing protein [Corynebacterium glutamicum]AIK84044.1 hypothetical protein CGLAR1_01900 [Corynebacterium glutamicum]AIK86806.1 hypothetical protein AR0_01895 [Corynebacterium glutamicum]